MLNRDWAKHKHRQHQQEIALISRVLRSQDNALEQLKNESEHLYRQAVEVRHRLSTNIGHQVMF
jgi:large subunit ribosomal protein L40